MAKILPMILEIAPQLAKYLFGVTGSAAAAAVGHLVQSVTGTVDPEHQVAVLSQDPSKADTLRLELAKLTAQLDAEQRAADLAAFRAQVAEVADARAMTLDLTRRSPLAWGSVIVSVVVLATFGGMLGCLLTFHIPDSALALSNVMLGTLGTLATAVVNYWVGSSSGSRAKDAVLADTTRALAVASAPAPSPVVPVVVPPGAVPPT